MTANRRVITRRRALSSAALAMAASLGLAGCVSLPSTSTPKVIDTFAPKASGVQVPSPVPDQEPDLLVRDFVKASSRPDQRHEAARQFLTSQASDKWDDSASAAVVLRADLSASGRRTADTATYTLTGEKVGDLGAGGVFTSEEGEVNIEIELVRVDGQWRIDSIPPGVVMERADFYSSYSMHNLYFLDPGRKQLVPDPRWLSASSSEVAPSLLNMIAGDPRTSLRGTVSNRLGPSVSVRPSPTDGNQESGTTVDFQGLQTMSSEEIEEFAAQVVWTLSDAEVPGPYRLERDGAPIDERHSGGWSVEDVESFDPNPDGGQLEYVLTSADGLVRLTGSAAQRFGGPWSGIADSRYARLSPDGKQLALVAGDGASSGSGAVLKIGPLDGSPADILRGPGITSPSWSQVDNSLWFLGADGKVSRLSDPSDPGSAGTVGQDAIDSVGGTVSDMALDPTGTRLVFVADGHAYISVIRYGANEPVLGAPLRVGQSLDNTITSVGWLGRDSILVGRSAVDAPVARITVDGAMTESQSGRNISARIDAVASSGSHIYALDQRSLLELDTEADDAARYWQEVPGLSGIRAFPVVHG
ncbi:LpqB family beta-propeller domain-containing protein [Dietzia sp.]|uniref:LpqB family beta-propeller domain-containing protein n=1 Tax=Dietzia sp. TaxID=1871616 RepID=UPI002FD9F68E